MANYMKEVRLQGIKVVHIKDREQINDFFVGKKGAEDVKAKLSAEAFKILT
jgi:hypothetical protein